MATLLKTSEFEFYVTVGFNCIFWAFAGFVGALRAI
jgi:hypothetical protein